MDFTIFIVVLFAMQILCLIIGSRVSKKLKTQDDYYLAGKTVSFFPLVMTFVATQIGGGLVLGAAEEAYQFGWSVLLYPLGASLGFLFLASGIGKRMAQYRVSTVAQLFEVIYRSASLKKLASLLSIISLFMIVVAQVIASKKFMISLGFDQNYVFFGFWGLVIVYTVLGGMRAVIATDIVQALFFIAVFSVCAFYTIAYGPMPLKALGWQSNQFNLDSSKLCGWLFMPLLFMVIEQDMAQRCFAAVSGKIVSWAATCAALCTLAVCIIPVYIGVMGKTLGIQIPEGSSVFMLVVQQCTTPAITAFVGCAIIAAIISTADALINAISSNLTQDFDIPYFNQKRGILGSQIASGIIALTAIMCSFYFKNVVDLLILSYELSISCLFIPIFIGIFKKKGNTLSAWIAITFGALGFCIFRLMPIVIPKEIASILLSSVGYGLGELVIRTQNIQTAATEIRNQINGTEGYYQ